MARTEPRRTCRGFHAAEGVARPAGRALEGGRRFGLRDSSLVGDRLYVFARQAENEVMAALDAGSGKVLWRTSYPAPFKMDTAAAPHGPGPKSTPAYADGKLFSIGMSGIVTAFDAASGKRLWQKPGLPAAAVDVTFLLAAGRSRPRDHPHRRQRSGHAQRVRRQHRRGEVGVERRRPGYGSPMLFEFGGTPQIVTMTQQKFIGLEAATGRLLWERTYTTEYAQNIITPVRFGDTLIVSGFHKPMVAFRVTRQKDQWRAEQVWENADVSLYMSDAVLDGETLVGFSERRSGQFFALDARSGKTLWTSEPRQGTNAAIVSAGEFWFALKDDGELIVAPWKTNAFAPLRRYPVATERNLGATGHRRQSRSSSRICLDACVVDARLNSRRLDADAVGFGTLLVRKPITRGRLATVGLLSRSSRGTPCVRGTPATVPRKPCGYSALPEATEPTI